MKLTKKQIIIGVSALVVLTTTIILISRRRKRLLEEEEKNKNAEIKIEDVVVTPINTSGKQTEADLSAKGYSGDEIIKIMSSQEYKDGKVF